MLPLGRSGLRLAGYIPDENDAETSCTTGTIGYETVMFPNQPPDTFSHDPDSRGNARWSNPVKLVDYADYADAQAAVDALSDQGFPVASVSIVWSGLRRVEHVTSRRTVVGAAVEGAISGAWFGTLIGLILMLFVDLATGSDVGLVFTYFLVGAAAGAVWYGAGHALRRGRRDFTTVPVMEAERYELWVLSETADLAAELLGVHSHRPMDPDAERKDADQVADGPRPPDA